MNNKHNLNIEFQSIVGFVSFQQIADFLQLINLVIFKNQTIVFFFISQDVQELKSSKCLTDSILECFVLFVYSSVLLFTVIFNDIVNVNLSSLKECSRNIWISMIADLNLFALDLYLFK